MGFRWFGIYKKITMITIDGRTTKKLRRNGIALITALLLAVFLFILGIFFLTFIDRDVFFASKQQSNMDAYFLTRSGMEYYQATGLPANIGDPPVTIQIPQGNNQRTVTIALQSSGDIIFTGITRSISGQVKAKRTLVAPGGNIDNWYEI